MRFVILALAFMSLAFSCYPVEAWPLYYCSWPSYYSYQPYYYQPWSYFGTWGVPTFYYTYTMPRPRAPRLTEKQVYERKVEVITAKRAYEDKVLDSAIAKRDKELETARRWAEIREKEQRYRDRGYLPPLPTRKFVVNGKDYGSFDNFKRYPEFQEYLAKIEAEREAESASKMISKEREAYINAAWLGVRRRSVYEEEMSKARSSVMSSIEADIISGRYSAHETAKLLDLWKSLQ